MDQHMFMACTVHTTLFRLGGVNVDLYFFAVFGEEYSCLVILKRIQINPTADTITTITFGPKLLSNSVAIVHPVIWWRGKVELPVTHYWEAHWVQ